MPGDRLLRRTLRSNTRRRRSASVDVDGAAAHALRDAGLGQRAAPSSRARIRSRFGPWTFRSTPMMWTLKSCRSVPSKTVRPIPDHARPDLVDGHQRVWRPERETPSRAAAPGPRAAVRIFMCMLRETVGCLIPVIRTKCLRVKQKGGNVAPSWWPSSASSHANRRGTSSSYWWWYASAGERLR